MNVKVAIQDSDDPEEGFPWDVRMVVDSILGEAMLALLRRLIERVKFRPALAEECVAQIFGKN